MSSYRIERDRVGELQVPAEALWRAQTQRAVQNFPISGPTLSWAFIATPRLVKDAAVKANTGMGLSVPGA